MYTVLLQEVMPQYYAYLRAARKVEFEGRPLWEYVVDSDEFEDKWFTQKGIKRIRLENDREVTCALGFRSRGHYIMWLLKWS